MVKKLFALASMTALTGVVTAGSSAGCSTTVTEVPADSGSGTPTPEEDSGPSVKPKPQPQDSGPGEPSTCPTEDPIDATKAPWKSPTIAPGSCTEADLTKMGSDLGAQGGTIAKMKEGIATDACRNCVFAQDGATWAPLVENASGQLTNLNVGGCIAIASGNDDCGKAYQQFRSCYLAACEQCDEGAFQSCTGKAVNGTACRDAVQDLLDACGGEAPLTAAETACQNTAYVFEAPIRAQCIGGIGDAGTDSGT